MKKGNMPYKCNSVQVGEHRTVYVAHEPSYKPNKVIVEPEADDHNQLEFSLRLTPDQATLLGMYLLHYANRAAFADLNYKERDRF